MGLERPERERASTQVDDEGLPFEDTPRFRILRRLGAGGMGVVYEAEDLERGGRVALKTLRATNPQSLYRFKQEFRALAEIVHPRLVRLYELISDGERWFFTMELIEDGMNLLEWLHREPKKEQSRETLAQARTIMARPSVSPTDPGVLTEVEGPLDWPETAVTEEPGSDVGWLDAETSLPAAPHQRVRAAFAQLAEGVRVLHAAGKLHRDLKPENVYVRASTGEVVLLDFGLVAALDQAAASEPPASGPAGAMLGVEAGASGTHTASHAYLATEAGTVAGTFAYMAPEQAMAQPLTPATDWYAVGVMLYQALTGVLPFRGSGTQILIQKQRGKLPMVPAKRVPGTPQDLSELCMELLSNAPAERPPAADVVRRLGGVIERDEAEETARLLFVGRTQQLEALWQRFEASAEGATAVHVHGRSGAGKSALLGRFLAQVERRADTLVIAGRCYEHEFIPFKAIDSLMDALTHHLLKRPAAEIEELLPADASVLGRVFPVLGRLVPPDSVQADSGDLYSVRRRAFATMRELLHRLSRRARLVLFIDDLQWGDVDSAALLSEVLRPPGAPRLLLLLSYRSEQRVQNPCLLAFSEACRAASTPDRELYVDVGSLAGEDARELAERLLGGDCDGATLDWVLQQAAGSAFLIHELSRYLRLGGARAGAEGLSLDDILWERVCALPDEPRKLVSVVAVAGQPVQLRHAQRAAGISALAPPVVASLCRDRLLRTEGTGPGTELETFHDRVRESIVARVPPAEISAQAAALAHVLEEADERDAETLAALLERAGELGRASTYYAAAVPGAVRALAFERAAALADKAIELAQTDEELAAAYEAAIHFHTDMANFPEAYELTRRGAAALGLELPAKFVPPLLILDFVVAKLKLLGKPAEHVLELPTMPEGRLALAVRLANAGAKAAFQVRPELCVAVCTKVVRLCLTHGNSPDSAIAYMVFGAIFQGGIMGRYKTGYDLGRVALELIEKYENERQRAEVSFVVGYFGTSWLRPAEDAEALWATAFEAGRASGDLFHMGCAAAGRVMSLSMRGVDLVRIEQESAELCVLLERNGLREPLAVVAGARQAARNLRGATRTLGSWDGDGYDEGAETEAWSSFGARHFAHYCHLARARSFYLCGRIEEATTALQAARRLAPESKGMLHSAEHVFVEALVTAAQSQGSLGARRAVGRAAARLDAWARHCPANFAPKAALVRAESLRLRGRDRAALGAYARAAELASEFGHVHVEGLAHLLRARLHAQRGEQDLHEPALAAAGKSFRRWGATALADQVARGA